jgi:hypothetical protein
MTLRGDARCLSPDGIDKTLGNAKRSGTVHTATGLKVLRG